MSYVGNASIALNAFEMIELRIKMLFSLRKSHLISRPVEYRRASASGYGLSRPKWEFSLAPKPAMHATCPDHMTSITFEVHFRILEDLIIRARKQNPGEVIPQDNE